MSASSKVLLSASDLRNVSLYAAPPDSNAFKPTSTPTAATLPAVFITVDAKPIGKASCNASTATTFKDNGFSITAFAPAMTLSNP